MILNVILHRSDQMGKDGSGRGEEGKEGEDGWSREAGKGVERGGERGREGGREGG